VIDAFDGAEIAHGVCLLASFEDNATTEPSQEVKQH
jgi:hypothetical protein